MITLEKSVQKVVFAKHVSQFQLHAENKSAEMAVYAEVTCGYIVELRWDVM